MVDNNGEPLIKEESHRKRDQLIRRAIRAKVLLDEALDALATLKGEFDIAEEDAAEVMDYDHGYYLKCDGATYRAEYRSGEFGSMSKLKVERAYL